MYRVARRSKMLPLCMLASAIFLGCVTSMPAQIQSAEPPANLDLRLQTLRETIQQRCADQQVPGLAVAVVLDGHVVLSEGFGWADVAAQRPVTEHTLFAIGSTTKAFTSTLIGMLVDEGTLSWDDPITRWLPELNLVPRVSGETPEAEVTIRDMLSHRTGFTRMSILWASGTASPEQIIAAAATAEPWDTFRRNFHYNNVMYLAVGTAAGRAAGTDYNSLLTERILNPLEMTESNLTYDAMQQAPDHALGYQRGDDAASVKFIPMRNVDKMAPAGSINSNIHDMTHWLEFLLDNGQWGGTRLVSEHALAETQSPQIRVSPDTEYGFGWFIRTYQGARMYEHGGGIDGFTASVALFPDEHLGVVALSNLSGATLPGQIAGLAYDTLLHGDGSVTSGVTDEQQQDQESPVIPNLDDFTGRYVANFGPFKEAIFTVSVKDDRTLAVDVPGQQNYELRRPDSDGRWTFVTAPDIAVSFERDTAGSVVLMHLYQAGFEFEVPREGYVPAAEIDPDAVRKYLGLYRAEAMNLEAKVVIQNRRLAVDVPGQMVYELKPPDENGRWSFRISDQIGVSFDDGNEDGVIDGMTMDQGGQRFVLTRVNEGIPANDLPLPTANELAQLREINGSIVRLEPDRIHLLTGSIHFAHAGVQGDLTLYFADKGRYRQEMMLGVFGHAESAVNGDRAEVLSSFQPYQELTGTELVQARVSHPIALFGPWDEYFSQVTVLRRDEVLDRPVYVVRLEQAVASGQPVPPPTVFVDAENGRLWRSEAIQIVPGTVGLLTTTEYDDYRTEFGITLPYRITVTNEYNGRVIMQFDRLEQPPRIEPAIFTIRPLPVLDDAATNPHDPG